MKISKTDIIIIGGGLAGLTMAALLGARGIKTLCLDREMPVKTLAHDFDGRTTAISYGSRLILEQAGIWPKIAQDACPIKSIKIADQSYPVFLDFDYSEAGDNPFGWIVENRLLRHALYQRAAELPAVMHLAPVAVQSLQRNNYSITVTLDDGRLFEAPLLIGADGRRSFVREWAGIACTIKDYQHDALVCVAAHENPHEFTALEHFHATGPFAVLPMTDDETGWHRSSIVWTEPRDQAGYYMTLSEKDFNHELQRRFGDWLGQVKTLSQRFRFPLALQHAKSFYADRIALIGDAAHGIHPIAGQGLNLGFRDTQTLSDMIAEAKTLGLDPGSSILLETYHKRRIIDSKTMALGTDNLDRLFSNDKLSLAALRQTGLKLVNHMPLVKRFFMRHAMGLTPFLKQNN